LTALLVAILLGLFFAPAAIAGPEKTPDQTLNDHPSGKDRNEEPGKSGTQGKAKSDPDDMANNGPDKLGMAGGFDEDKDGNNGCGNDDDFEDDNNGWCGGKPKVLAVTTVKTPEVKPEVTPTVQTDVLGETFVRPAGPVAVLASTAVAAAPATAAAAPSALARTGQSLATLFAVALVLCNAGAACLMVAERRRLAPVRIRTGR
jgi:hypothetical protein